MFWDCGQSAGGPRATAPATAWYIARAVAGLVALLWILRGALGSPADILLALLLGLAFGAAVALLLHRTWFPSLRTDTRGRGADLFTGGIVAGAATLIMASGLSHNGAQLLLMLALPGLGWLAVALTYAPGGHDWRPAFSLLGLSTAAILLFTDTDPMAIEVFDPALGWTFQTAGLLILFGWLTGLVAMMMRRHWGMPGKPHLAAGAAAVIWIGALALYFGAGQPGLYGDRLFVVLADQADVSAAATIDDYDARRQYVYTTLVDHAETTQAGLRSRLSSLGMGFTPYYLVNGLEVDGGLLTSLFLRMQPEVDRVLPSPRLRPLSSPLGIESGDLGLPSDHDWNLTMLGAEQVWSNSAHGVRALSSASPTRAFSVIIRN